MGTRYWAIRPARVTVPFPHLCATERRKQVSTGPARRFANRASAISYRAKRPNTGECYAFRAGSRYGGTAQHETDPQRQKSLENAITGNGAPPSPPSFYRHKCPSEAPRRCDQLCAPRPKLQVGIGSFDTRVPRRPAGTGGSTDSP